MRQRSYLLFREGIIAGLRTGQRRRLFGLGHHADSLGDSPNSFPRHVHPQRFLQGIRRLLKGLLDPQPTGAPRQARREGARAQAQALIKVLLERGVLGHIYSVLHLNRGFQDRPGSWFVTLENFNIVDHGIHYIDLSRYFTGQNPERVKATTTRVPDQIAVTPMIYSILLEYAPAAQVMATLHFNNIVPTSAMHRYEWFLDGTKGSASASQTDPVVSFKDNPEQRQVFALQGHWFPDAFGGSMGEMLTALAERREPATVGHDNLKTIRIACAAVESSNTGQTVELDNSVPGG